MAHSLFVLDSFGSVIIEKHYLGLINRSVVEQFWDEAQKSSPHMEEVKPVIATQKNYLIHVQKNELFFLGITSLDVVPLLVIEFLNRVVQTFNDYFDSVNELSLKDNFIVAYQLLDEMNDGGYPFNLEPNILQEMISIPSILNKTQNLVMGPGSTMSSILPDGSLSAIPWRRQGVKYTTNEIYLDIIDEIDAIIESNGALTTCKINGYVSVDCQLSGMPDMVLKFRNPGIFDDVSLHPCVRLTRWTREQVLSFVPPDGKFKLMEFCSRGNIQIPIYVQPQVRFHEGTGTCHVMIGTKHVTDRPIDDIVIRISFASNCSGVTLTSKVGVVNFDESTKVCEWKIKQLPKNQTPVLDGNFAFDSATVPVKPTVTVNFTVNMWSASGLKVESLTLLNEKYNHFKGVKSIAKAGRLQIRM